MGFLLSHTFNFVIQGSSERILSADYMHSEKTCGFFNSFSGDDILSVAMNPYDVIFQNEFLQLLFHFLPYRS